MVLAGLLACLAPVAAAPSSPLERIEQLLAAAEQARSEREWDLADSRLREASGIALDQLGAAYARLGRLDEAAQAYREACASTIQSIRPYLGLAIVHLRTGRYAEGIQLLEKILEISPMNPQAKHLLGKYYYLQGDFKSAVRELRDAYQGAPEDLSVAYTLALAHLELKELDEARRIFAALQEKFGESAALHVLFGRAYRETDFFAEAAAEFQRAIELDPTYPRVHYYLGLTYLRWENAAAFDKAQAAFRRELENNPDEYLPNFFLGVILSMERRDEEAERHLKKAVELDPENPDPHLYLGQILNRRGQYEAAVEALETSLRLTKDPARNNYQVSNTHYVLGQILLRLGRREEAREHLAKSQEYKRLQDQATKQDFQAKLNVETTGSVAGAGGGEAQAMAAELRSLGTGEVAVVLDEPPPDAETAERLRKAVETYRTAAAQIYERRARLAAGQEDFATAARLLENAYRWYPTLPRLGFNLALAHYKAKNLDQAVPPLVRFLEADPESAEGWQLLAQLALELVQQDRGRAAVPAFELLARRQPSQAGFWVLYGQAEAQAGNYDLALAHFRRALELQSDLPEVHFYCGMALLRQGKLTEALEEFRTEAARRPDHVGALYHQAFILITQHRLEEAEPLLKRVIALDPRYADAYYQLGKMQLEKRQILQAVANLETAGKLASDRSHIFYQLSRAYNLAGRRDDALRALEEYRRLKQLEEARRDGRPVPTGAAASSSR
ncbi:MAG: hypothetical protein Kow00109_24090 [Acidobacteriota bacterium]